MRINDNAYQAIFNAAQVISLSNGAATALGDADPKALAQLRGAIKAVQAEIDVGVALGAMAEKFDSVTEITFLSPEQEAAVLALLEDVVGTLMMRGRGRLSSKLGADAARLLAKYHADTATEREVAAMTRGQRVTDAT